MGNTTEVQELTQPLAVKEQQVRKLAFLVTGLVADRSTYECVIDQALALVLDGLESGYRAKDQVDCLVDIARVQAQAGDRAGAQANFSLAVTAAEALPEEDHYEGWNRLEVLSDIAKAQAEVGEIARAMALVQTFTPRLLQAKPMTKIAQTQAEAGDRAGALETLSKAQSLVQTIADKEYRDTLLATSPKSKPRQGTLHRRRESPERSTTKTVGTGLAGGHRCSRSQGARPGGRPCRCPSELLRSGEDGAGPAARVDLWREKSP